MTWTFAPQTAYAVQVLARHQMIERLLADIQQDMMVCRLEGWPPDEYPRMLWRALDGLPGFGKVDEGRRDA